MDAIIWTIVAALATVGGLQLGIMKWVSSFASRLSNAETSAKTADTMAAHALGKCELLGTDFHNHRVEIAAKVSDINARAEGAAVAIINAENRFAKSLDEFGDRIDQIVERLDRVLEGSTAPVRRRKRS